MKINNKELNDSLIELGKCFSRVNDAYDKSDNDCETFADNYPFSKSFDDLALEVSEWIKKITS